MNRRPRLSELGQAVVILLCALAVSICYLAFIWR